MEITICVGRESSYYREDFDEFKVLPEDFKSFVDRLYSNHKITKIDVVSNCILFYCEESR